MAGRDTEPGIGTRTAGMLERDGDVGGAAAPGAALAACDEGAGAGGGFEGAVFGGAAGGGFDGARGGSTTGTTTPPGNVSSGSPPRQSFQLSSTNGGRSGRELNA
jgi:hypothetical protein